MNDIDTSQPASKVNFHSLRELIDQCGPNKNDQVTAVITACIHSGVCSGPELVGIGRALGFNPDHVGKILHDGTGKSPQRHWWWKDDAGQYHSHGDS